MKTQINVIKSIATISTRGKYILKLQYANWGDNKPKYDLRNFIQTVDGHELVGKGLCLDKGQMKVLKKVLNSMEELDDEPQEVEKEIPQGEPLF